jgi:hypothetical protein
MTKQKKWIIVKNRINTVLDNNVSKRNFAALKIEIIYATYVRKQLIKLLRRDHMILKHQCKATGDGKCVKGQLD